MRKVLPVLLMLLAGIAYAAPGAPPAQSAPPALKGEVIEVKDVDAYTYLRLKTGSGEVWAAVTKTPVRKGAEVSIENPMVMQNFTSKTLNRTFDRIVFGNLAGAGTGSAPAGMPRGASAGDVKVPKATGPGAHTVAEINAAKAELKGKPVQVRGKVVRYTPEVLGKNWIHLQDGSGSAADKTNDILVTSKDATRIGDVVVASGVVRTDVDLGSGYAYAVMVDEAKLAK